MKKNILFLAFALLISLSSFGQKLSTRSGYVKFFSATPIENIEAENNIVSSVVDLTSGKFAFLVQIKSFQFEKALMQEHFNENYMESGDFPKASFKGSITNYKDINFSKDGTYEGVMKGIMEIHGVKKEITKNVTVTVKGDKVSMESKFNLKPEDYGVKIPAAKKDNISDTLEITVKMDYAKK